MMQAERHALPGGRWHLRHGPIDIVIGAEGEAAALFRAHEAAWQRFQPLLGELVAELPALRRRVDVDCPVEGAVARRMWQACAPFRDIYITPMAAVAGSVAQELAACYAIDGVHRAWINNGGDIALHLAPGASVRVGLFADLARFDPLSADRIEQIDAAMTLTADQPVRGVATSGWRGRSFSLGIADAVTVLARSAAEADAAATVIANAVDVDDVRIVRRPASSLRDDSDLGEIPVTVDVPALEREPVERALRAGLQCARRLRERGLIEDAALFCQGLFCSLSREVGEGWGRSGAFRPHAACPRSDDGLQAVVRPAREGASLPAAPPSPPPSPASGRGSHFINR